MSLPVFTSAEIRAKTIELSCRTGAGHLAPSLSCVEILTVLFRDYLTYAIGNPSYEQRDKLVFSKGHGAYAYYVILNELGFIPADELQNFYTEKSSLKGCLSINKQYMIEASTGSLGHGLPIAVGMAKANKLLGINAKVVCIVGDGEMQEGSNYEALQFAHQHKLDNLLLIVDANGLQAMDWIGDVGFNNDKLSRVLKAIAEDGHFSDIDGHNEEVLKNEFDTFFHGKRSSFTILNARTIKGRGIKMAENNKAYHFRCPVEDGYDYEA